MPETSDFLVIGTGIAGLSYALRVAEHGTVNIITKKERAESSTNRAQGGIAAALGPDDSLGLHIQDTLEVGAGLCHSEAVELVVGEGPAAIRELIEWGVRFSRESHDDSLSLGKEAAHSRSRIVHAGDITGREIESAMLERIQRHPRIGVFEHHAAIDLITEHHLAHRARQRSRSTCWGAYALDAHAGKVKRFLAPITLLATGGVGQVYLHTTNPSIATGDGLAMVYRAGACVADLEFMQFHPTMLYRHEGEPFLISEAVRGFGGVIINGAGEDFISQWDPRGSLASRDVVARAIDAEMKHTGEPCVYLDVSHLRQDALRQRFPNIVATCEAAGIDTERKPIPVVSGAHYMCGGVVADLDGRTGILGLYACGEVAFTGVHGANRLASNSLLEAVVFAQRAACNAVTALGRASPLPEVPPWDEGGVFNTEEWVILSHDRDQIRRLMWDYVGIVRSTFRLERALRRIDLIRGEVEAFYRRTRVTFDLIELRNMATVAWLMIRSALARKESRGLHYTTDYRNRDDAHWHVDTVLHGHDIAFKPIPDPAAPTTKP